ITIDDGTGQINLIMFSEKEKADNLDVADVIMTIGKPREYNTQRYIVPEIMRKIQNKKWIMYRRKELETIQNNPEQETEKKVEPKKEIQIQEKKIELPEPRNEKENITQKIIRLIKQKDKGDGANIEEVLQEANDKDAEKNLNILINEGEIFEVRAGKVKVLD
ncbi:OB-fold nucleic acid binding domain-containing protein, partial [Candidatus Woesearchaeota archaeon]|nr:OB-fold nucleic acid binding domain-containing protein [Candidatus Woesearchaeota archaeon]